MRNDARPIGHDADGQSPIDSDHTAVDSRDTVAHGRESHIVNRDAEVDARRDDADTDPVMPAGDSTLRTQI